MFAQPSLSRSRRRFGGIGSFTGIVTFASFTCQPRGALEDRMEENQRFRELAIVANPLENRLFLASVTMPTCLLDNVLRRFNMTRRDMSALLKADAETPRSHIELVEWIDLADRMRATQTDVSLQGEDARH